MDLRKRDGTPLGQIPVAADWEPAWEAARFLAIRRFPRAAIGANAVAEVRPAWHEDLGPPYVSAVDVALHVPGAGKLSCRVPNSFFKSLASDASVPLVKKGSLQAGEHFNYLISAFPSPPAVRDVAQLRARFEIEEVPTPLPLKSSLLDDFSARSFPAGEQNEEDIPVFVHQHVLAEADQLTRDAAAVETASVLIGHMHRDTSGGDLFLEVTAQIPARNSQATALKVTFGPETWNAVQSALALRSGNEQWVGWFHSHPAASWCNPDCPPENRAKCPMQRSFFSADDCDVHRTVFFKAFHIALLVTNTDAGLEHALFSWRNGVIVQRGFQILKNEEEQNPAIAPVAVATIGEAENEKACP
jgi:proteasome lid subunit RPN8/RPN11